MKNGGMLRYYYKIINIISFFILITAYVVMLYMTMVCDQHYIVALLAAVGTTVTVYFFIRDTFSQHTKNGYHIILSLRL